MNVKIMFFFYVITISVQTFYFLYIFYVLKEEQVKGINFSA